MTLLEREEKYNRQRAISYNAIIDMKPIIYSKGLNSDEKIILCHIVNSNGLSGNGYYYQSIELMLLLDKKIEEVKNSILNLMDKGYIILEEEEPIIYATVKTHNLLLDFKR